MESCNSRWPFHNIFHFKDHVIWGARAVIFPLILSSKKKYHLEKKYQVEREKKNKERQTVGKVDTVCRWGYNIQLNWTCGAVMRWETCFRAMMLNSEVAGYNLVIKPKFAFSLTKIIILIYWHRLFLTKIGLLFIYNYST